MPKKQLKARNSQDGFTLVELMIALFISAVIIGAIVSLYTTSVKTFQKVKDVADVKELGKSGMAQLEWIFQRWGTSTPCNNPVLANCTSVAVDCRDINGLYPYPPPSMVCMTITDNTTFDEAQFYANLSGNGFVHSSTLADSTIMEVKSCRLSTASNNKNCYHIKMGSQFFLNQANTGVVTPLIFSLSGLSSNTLACTDGSITPNGTLSADVTAMNGSVRDNAGALTTTYTLQGGEILLRVPHRVRLFCQANSEDQNRMWLYMQATDMASLCNDDEPAQPLIPVNYFDIKTQGQGVVVNMQVRGTDGKALNIQRYFGR